MSFGKKSTALKNSQLTTGSLKSALDGGFLRFFSGAVPADANALVAGSELVMLTDGDDGVTGLTFDSPAANGVLVKDPGETWRGTAAGAGTATFARWTMGADDGTTADATKVRMQFTVGTDISADIVLPSTTISVSDVIELSAFQLADIDL